MIHQGAANSIAACCNRSQESYTKLSGLLLHLCILYLTDVDECVNDAAICGPNANCTNSVGSYSCTCFPGYRLNNTGEIASAVNPCTGVWTRSLLLWLFILQSYLLLLCIFSPLQISMSAVRHLAYVVNKLCVLMYQGPSTVLVLMDFSLQLELCGR